jgi:hypothetical protein
MSSCHRSASRRIWPWSTREAIQVAVAIQVLLWFGVFFYTAEHTNPEGDGMEWVGIMPASFVLAIGTLPGLRLRNSARLLPLGVLLACIGVVLSIAFFFEIIRETELGG